MTSQMTGAKMVVKALKDQGVDTVFGYPGGAVLPIYDEIFQQNEIRHILVRHEQGAVHAAEGYARSTGKPGVVLVTSGPRRDQRCYRIDRRFNGFYSFSCSYWTGTYLYDRLRRFSGSRYGWDHKTMY